MCLFKSTISFLVPPLCPLLPTGHLTLSDGLSLSGAATNSTSHTNRTSHKVMKLCSASINTESDLTGKSNYLQKRKTTVKEKTGTKRGKVCREHAEPPCPSEAGTSTLRGPPPPPRTSSSARSSTSLTEVHAVCSSSPRFLQPETVHPGLPLLISCITPLTPINLLWQR